MYSYKITYISGGALYTSIVNATDISAAISNSTEIDIYGDIILKIELNPQSG